MWYWLCWCCSLLFEWSEMTLLTHCLFSANNKEHKLILDNCLKSFFHILPKYGYKPIYLIGLNHTLLKWSWSATTKWMRKNAKTRGSYIVYFYWKMFLIVKLGRLPKFPFHFWIRQLISLPCCAKSSSVSPTFYVHGNLHWCLTGL